MEVVTEEVMEEATEEAMEDIAKITETEMETVMVMVEAKVTTTRVTMAAVAVTATGSVGSNNRSSSARKTHLLARSPSRALLPAFLMSSVSTPRKI